MFRRSRFSVRPNVGTAGRSTATPQEAPSANQDPSETPRDVGESISGPTVADDNSPPEKTTAPGEASDQTVEGSNSSAAVQRRKRFCVKPKVAPGRTAPLARTPKSPVKSVSDTPVKSSGSDDKPTTSSTAGPTTASQGLVSPRRRRLSEDAKQAKVQPKPTTIPPESSAHSDVHPAEVSPKQTHLPGDGGKRLQNISASQVKEASPRVPIIIPDKEAIELSEKAKTLVSKSRLSLSPSALSLSRLLNDPSDIQRLAKAQKLKELLRQEWHKERKIKKAKARVKEYTLDPAKMTMRDLIHYVPLSNPMTSNLENSIQEDETVVPTSPERDESPERAQTPEVIPEVIPKMMSQSEEENEEADAEQDEDIMVPQVKVAEDGSLIIDEESLTVEVQRAKGPNPAQDRDPIFERGSTTTYSSFRKGTCSKPWSSEETDMFFLAISMVGTDFSMICQLFPHRARAEIKNKFKKEERVNAWRVDKAFRERRKLDIEYFSKLLEKILEFQNNRKKLRSLVVKNAPKTQRKRKAKGKKASRKLSDVDEEDEEDETLPDLEDEVGGEKENELLCNEGETTASKPKKQQKRKTGKDDLNKEPSNKKNKMDENSSEQDQPSIPEDTKAALPEDPQNSDMSEKTENADAKDIAVKPAKLSRGRAPKPLLPLGRKWGKKVPQPSTKGTDSGNESVKDGANNEVNKDASPSKIIDENSSEEDDAPVPPPKPTRYGRIPKPTKLLAYSSKEDGHLSASETTPCSPGQHTATAARSKPKNTAKRGRQSVPPSEQESKKPKLITLRASQSNDSDEEDHQQSEQKEDEEEQKPACSPSKDSSTTAFVPTSLRSPPSKVSLVEDSMEELDILANMPDVLGISQDALCPDAYCEQAQNETGIAEPCEHQLDLLVDVIDFLSAEHTEVSEDESYNEAAQTLLTIGNLTHLFQTPQNQIALQDHLTGTTSNSETEHQPEGEISSNADEQCFTPCTSAASDYGVTECTEAVAIVELQPSTTDCADSDQICNVSDLNPTPQVQSAKTSPHNEKGNLPLLKPELGQPSRTTKLKSQPETATIIKPATESDSPEECTPSLDIKPTEEPSGNQETSRSKIEPVAKNQSHCFLEPSLVHANQETGAISSSKDEKLICEEKIIESGSSNSTASGISATEPHSTNTGSVQVQEDGQQSAPCVAAPVEDSLVSQKAECKVSPALQSRTRLQKVKPKPNLPQTCRATRSKPQVTKHSVEKDSSPSPFPKTITEVEPEPSCATPPEESTKSTSHVGLVPSLELSTTLTPTDISSTAEEKNTSDGLISQVDSGATTSGGISSENNNFCEDNFQPSIVETSSVSELSLQSCTNNKPIAEPNIDAGIGLELSSESSGPNTPQRRWRSVKVKPKPNLASSTRSPRSKLQSKEISNTSDKNNLNKSSNVIIEQTSAPRSGEHSELEPNERDDISMDSSLHRELPDPTRSSVAEIKTSVDSASYKGLSSDGITLATPQSVLRDSAENQSGEKSMTKKPSDNNEVEVKVSSQGICKVDVSTRAAGLNTQPTDDSGSFSKRQSSACTKSQMDLILTSYRDSTPDTKESSHQCLKSDSEDKGQDAAQHYPETSKVNLQSNNKPLAADSIDESQLESCGPSSSSGKAPPRRGRLIKPKPNLRRNSQLPKVQNATKAEADPRTLSKEVEPSGYQRCASELRPEKEPLDGAVEPHSSSDHTVKQLGQQNTSSRASESSLPCSLQVPSTQTVSTSSSEGAQGHPCLFSNMLSEQVPSDPEEPFFILSLTEIPVCSSGEVVDSAAEPLSYLPVTDSSIPQLSSLPGGRLEAAAAGEGSISDAPVMVSNEESGELSRVNVNDTGVDTSTHKPDLIMKTPADEKTTVQKPKTVESNNETENPATKQRVRGTGRGGKTQVKPTRARTKQASKTPAADTTQHSHPLQPFVLLETCDARAKADDEVVTKPLKKGCGQVDIKKESPTSVDDVSTRAQTLNTKTRVASSRTRKPKDSTNPSSVPPPSKAVSTSSEIKTPRASRRRPSLTPHSTPTPKPTPRPTKTSDEAPSPTSITSPTQTRTDTERNSQQLRWCSTPTTGASQSTDEVSAFQQSDCAESISMEEEPTSVSQYFLSDIFTDVEEG